MTFTIETMFFSKSEPLGSVTRRILASLDGLRAIHPELHKFVRNDEFTGRRDIPRDHDALERWIYEVNCFDGAAAPDPVNGYFFGMTTAHDFEDPRRLTINQHLGGTQSNRVLLRYKSEVPADQTDYRVVKAMLFALADVFDPLFTYADPGTLGEDWMPCGSERKPVYACWMMLIPPDLARQVAPPPGTVTQVRPDGSLFMAATDERFDAANPTHRAAAFAMKAAIEPINEWSTLRPRGSL